MINNTQKVVVKKEKTLKEQILDELPNENQIDVDKFASYCQRIRMEVDKRGQLRYPFMQRKSATELAGLFRRVKSEGLVFDGKHITLQSTGVTYDYVAYKNKMLLAYPNSKIDIGVVNKGDIFKFKKENGEISYTHDIADPFAEKLEITGAYCIIKNDRGEFLTTLNRDELEKHRKSAKTDSIWSAWFKEMVLKTVIKKACKYHFDDIFENINEMDNESYDPDQVVLSVQDEYKIDKTIDKIADMENIKELQTYFLGLESSLIKNGDIFEAYNAKKEELNKLTEVSPAKKVSKK